MKKIEEQIHRYIQSIVEPNSMPLRKNYSRANHLNKGQCKISKYFQQGDLTAFIPCTAEHFLSAQKVKQVSTTEKKINIREFYV